MSDVRYSHMYILYLRSLFWLSGEANTFYHQDNYNCSFPAMIDDWRMAFHKGSGGQTALDFPFGFVQVCWYFNLLSRNCTYNKTFENETVKTAQEVEGTFSKHFVKFEYF